jgi:hypothetical protein
MCFCNKEKTKASKVEKYYIPFDCSNCHAPDMVIYIKKGIRVSEFLEEENQKLMKCLKCGCFTSRKEGIKIEEKENGISKSI